MRLQEQYNRITIVSTLFILLIGAVAYYFVVRYVLIDQLDEDLKVEEIEIQDYIKKYKELPDETTYKDQRIEFKITNGPSRRKFESLKAFQPGENEMEPSRQLLFTVEVNGQRYLATVTKSEESNENLIWIILVTTLTLIVLLGVVLFFSNRFLVKKLWQPFQNTLAAIREFNLTAPANIAIKQSGIAEFNELNENIRLMSEKVLKDYHSLKNFTDHASHEIQTPLAIINSKLDTLIQEPELSEKSMTQLQAIYHAVDRLAHLTRSLLLLTRIENSQYSDSQPVLLDQVCEEKYHEWQEWTTAGYLKVERLLAPLLVTMNKELSEILVGNLFRNAVRHSNPGDSIFVETSGDKLIVSNTGKTTLDQTKIFDRFYKSDESEGSGLGLAIVRQICEQYGFKLGYQFTNGQHQFTVIF